MLGRNGVRQEFAVARDHRPPADHLGKILWKGEDIAKLPAHARAARGIGYVPQGREVFPLLSVKENLETGFAPVVRKRSQFIPDDVFELFPVLKSMMSRHRSVMSGGQQQQLAISRHLWPRPTLLVLDEPTEGIQPSIIKDIGRAIAYLRDKGDMAIVLVEQYFDFARDLADDFIVMDRGAVVIAGGQGLDGGARSARIYVSMTGAIGRSL